MTDAPKASLGPRRVALVSVGNELLYGETVDTNAAWLGRMLTAWGLVVTGGWAVRDRVEEIQNAVRRAVASADVVIVTGGLGPTSDDLTKPAVAEMLGRGLVVDEGTRARVEARFQSAGHAGTPGISLGQSEILAGSTALHNEHGTAPGILIDADEAMIVLLPGVPREMRGIVEGPLHEAWQQRGLLGGELHHRVIHTTGIAESHLAQRVQPLWDGLSEELSAGVGLAYLPDELGVDLRLSFSGADAASVDARLDRIVQALGSALSHWRFDAESGDLAEAVTNELRRLRLTLATAESCTGGLVATRMTERAGASDVFLGSVVAYDNHVKVSQLGVREDLLREHGAVSEPVARAMAEGVAERMGTEVAVSVTGVAGPSGGSAEKPVGTVWIATAVEGTTEASRNRFAGDRGSVRRRSAQAALHAVYRRLTATNRQA